MYEVFAEGSCKIDKVTTSQSVQSVSVKRRSRLVLSMEMVHIYSESYEMLVNGVKIQNFA